MVILVGGAGNDDEEAHPIVTRPGGMLTLHNHCGNNGSFTLVVSGTWYPSDAAEALVGVKLEINVAMQFGTLDPAVQLGAPGNDGFANMLGVEPKVFVP